MTANPPSAPTAEAALQAIRNDLRVPPWIRTIAAAALHTQATLSQGDDPLFIQGYFNDRFKAGERPSGFIGPKVDAVRIYQAMREVELQEERQRSAPMAEMAVKSLSRAQRVIFTIVQENTGPEVNGAKLFLPELDAAITALQQWNDAIFAAAKAKAIGNAVLALAQPTLSQGEAQGAEAVARLIADKLGDDFDDAPIVHEEHHPSTTKQDYIDAAEAVIAVLRQSVPVPAPEVRVTAEMFERGFKTAQNMAERLAREDRRYAGARAVEYVPTWQAHRWKLADEIKELVSPPAALSAALRAKE